MDPAGIEAPQGAVVMACEDCHREQAGGGLMAPIAFDAHCNACHRLSFDLSAPDRQVPHGDPQEALDQLVDFYAQLALRGGSAEVPVAALDSAPPDRALEWARKEAGRAAIDLVEDRACMQCHGVERQGSEQTIGWTIPPVHLNRSWLPAARFSHRSHRVAECGDCHAAAGSSSSNELLLPDIDTCRECHGGETGDNNLNSTCVDCHRFHHPERAPLHTSNSEHSASLSLEALPDREAEGRALRGMDPRRKRPGDGR
jgi:predicted CXXCH cytochrome family protein